MRTDARSDLIRAVDDNSTAAEKALWHCVVQMEEWVEDGRPLTTLNVQTLLARVESVLANPFNAENFPTITKAYEEAKAALAPTNESRGSAND